MESTKLFFSCDWGTSSFRLRLIKASTLEILAEVKNEMGIAAVFQTWQNERKEEKERLFFYQDFLQTNIEQLQRQVGYQVSGVPLILSGMASSSIGMKELPYKELPFSIDGSDLLVYTTAATQDIPDTVIVSGVRSETDVMRGEEIQLVGCSPDAATSSQLFILPGTHSKHILVEQDKVIDFKTYMTGELFQLLSTKSILAASLEAGSLFQDKNNKQGFETGVKHGLQLNPLHALFWVRTNQLFGTCSKEENYHYLSGLLIGAELKECANTRVRMVTLVCNLTLQPLYATALEQAGIDNYQTIDADKAIIQGHYRVFLNHCKKTVQ